MDKHEPTMLIFEQNKGADMEVFFLILTLIGVLTVLAVTYIISIKAQGKRQKILK